MSIVTYKEGNNVQVEEGKVYEDGDYILVEYEYRERPFLPKRKHKKRIKKDCIISIEDSHKYF